MNYGESGSLSPSDVALITNGRNGSNSGFADGNGAWWIIVFLIFAFLGLGNRGFGSSSDGSSTTYVPIGGGSFAGGSDNFATLQRQLDSAFATINADNNQINQAICNGFYNTNTNLLTGFGNTNLATANGFATTQRQLCESTDSINANINNNGYETRLLGVNMNSQLQQCCCDLRESLVKNACDVENLIKDTNYNMAMNNNAILQAMSTNTRDLIDNQNANYRALHDEIVANRIEDKNAQIAAQQGQINALQLAASQERQNNYLINQLRPCPTPAYITCNPWAGSNTFNNCGCNCGNV